MSTLKKYGFLLTALLLGLSSCQSLDDDSAYAISTKASFFLVQRPDGLQSIHKYRQGFWEADWNEKVGISATNLSDVEMVDNQLWIASGPAKAIFQVSPSYASIKDKFENLPLAPHYLAVGSKQIMVVDTLANEVAMIKRRNGHVQKLVYNGHPGKCIYNSGKFFLIQNQDSIAIYDEQAMTTRAVLSTNMHIDELLLNRYKLLIAMGHDSTQVKQALIDVNGDVVLNGNSYAINYAKFRPTPYFAARFGKEYLKDIRLTNGNAILDDGTVLADSISNFEVDFFESKLFYQQAGQVVEYDLINQLEIVRLTVDGTLLRAMHQYADE